MVNGRLQGIIPMTVSFSLANHDAFSQLISLQYFFGDFQKGNADGIGEDIGKGISA